MLRSGVLARMLAALGVRGTDPLARIPSARVHPQAAWDKAFLIEEALAASPGDARLHTRLGFAWAALDKIDEAVGAFEEALRLDPARQDAITGLGVVLREQGRLPEAVAHLRRALELRPDDRETFQTLLFMLLCLEGASEKEVFDWHVRYAQRFEAPLRSAWRPHPNSRDPARKLRVGYVSPEFWRHVVGFCMAPVLEHHDRSAVEVVCYSNRKLGDDLTEQLQGHADQWREIAAMTDAAVADLVREDRIDILVDLAGHAPGSRLEVFARKPAPVQVSYLDYSATTGLSSFDYRITVAACDPPGLADPYYTETLERIPGTFWLYNPPALPEPPQRSRAGVLRLASLNSFYRASSQALDTWAAILRGLPGAELIVVGVPAGEANRRLRARFEAQGVDPARLRIFGLLAYQDLLALIRASDIALAPFPYNGAMTMLDCLWQGVPVVALRGGNTFYTRMAHSILGALGLEELLADSPQDYCERVLRLAADAPRRAELRRVLREKIRGSALQDFTGLPRFLEAAYRRMWQRYCAAPV